MQKNYSYKDCYHILGVNPDCSWSELRKAYKKSIQKWHPDRFEDSTPEKSAADDKIKTINIAYNHVAKFYREEGKLPQISSINELDSSITKNKADFKATPRQQPGRTNNESTIKSDTGSVNTGSTRNYKKTATTLLIIVGLSYLYIYDVYKADETTVSQLKQPPTQHKIKLEQYSTNPSSHADAHQAGSSEIEPNKFDQRPDSVQEEIKEEYFTNGSSLSEVIGIQGPPTKTDGDIWFYGESEVHFKNGVVTHWVRNSETPLKARMSIEQIK